MALLRATGCSRATSFRRSAPLDFCRSSNLFATGQGQYGICEGRVNRLPTGLAFTIQGLGRMLLFPAAGQDGAVVSDLTVASALLSREAAR